MNDLFFTHLQTPVGELKLVASDAGLRAVLWPQDELSRRVVLPAATENTTHPILSAAARQLTEYFAGTRQAFALPLEFHGTEFQFNVWRALREIPFGATRSYGELAAALGNPAAVRAVAAAIGRNPLSIVAPCHRVVGKSGQLTGFAGGLEAKRWLLDWESVRSPR